MTRYYKATRRPCGGTGNEVWPSKISDFVKCLAHWFCNLFCLSLASDLNGVPYPMYFFCGNLNIISRLMVWICVCCLLAFQFYPPPCLEALLEWTDVEKQPSGGMLSCLTGTPPQYPRILAYTRVYSRTLARPFSTLFLMSKNQAHKPQNGSLGDPKITR